MADLTVIGAQVQYTHWQQWQGELGITEMNRGSKARARAGLRNLLNIWWNSHSLLNRPMSKAGY